MTKNLMSPDRPDWYDQAACTEVSPPVFYPALPSRHQNPELEAPAIAVCQTCPVRGACLAHGWNERWGVWGGVGEHRRLRLRRRADTARRSLEVVG